MPGAIRTTFAPFAQDYAATYRVSHGALNAHFFKTAFTGLQSYHLHLDYFGRLFFSRGWVGHDPGRAVTTACRTCAQPRESRPEPRPSRPGSGRPARPPRGSGCYYSVGRRRAATPLSPLQALAWAPAASMDARRVRVRAGWNNPRGWARRVLDSGRLPPALRTECCLSTTGGPGRFLFRQAPGFVHLG